MKQVEDLGQAFAESFNESKERKDTVNDCDDFSEVTVKREFSLEDSILLEGHGSLLSEKQL